MRRAERIDLEPWGFVSNSRIFVAFAASWAWTGWKDAVLRDRVERDRNRFRKEKRQVPGMRFSAKDVQRQSQDR